MVLVTLVHQPLLETIEYMGQQKVHQEVKADHKERDKEDAVPKGDVIARQHDVWKVRSRQQD